MHRKAALLLIMMLVPIAGWAQLSDALKSALKESRYIYVSSTRKDGSLGKPAEIWFLYHNDAVYVGTLPTSWRAKRIRWGRPLAKIAVGKADGPSFMATGAIVREADTEKVLLETFAKKYPDGWATHAERFRKGFQDGSRVLIKYTPKPGSKGKE
jgi:hypothetical protein